MKDNIIFQGKENLRFVYSQAEYYCSHIWAYVAFSYRPHFRLKIVCYFNV